MPSPNRVRFATYVNKEVAAAFEREARRLGLSTSALLAELIAQWAPTSEQYFVRQHGHQAMMALAFITALAKRTLSEAEFAEVRAVGFKAGKLVFGDIPPRPFEPDIHDELDPRLIALLKALIDR